MDFSGVVALFARPVLTVSGEDVGLGTALLFALLAARLLAWARGLLRGGTATGGAEGSHLDAISREQAEITGRMRTMAEILGTRQADLARIVSERLDGLSQRLGSTVSETARETRASLSTLAERQAEIGGLAGEVVRLQDILANKQSRGAFGQGRMEAIVTDALPASAYAFQATLSNGRRPDCLIHMPNGAPALAIDAKFPLEAWTAFCEAVEEGPRGAAAQRMRRDMDVHVRAVAEKYLLPGETQDTAMLFVPSESIFADLHEHFSDVVQKALRLRVVIVSPSLLMLSIQLVQSLLKDARMRREAGRIQTEVRLFLEDLQRLDARVAALKTHFGHVGRDVDQILVSTERLVRRGERIDLADLGPDAPQVAAAR